MAIATLGKQIDIHTGGEDHVPIHHNAEIAQCEAATGKTFVKYWLHNAFITIENSRIGKSMGNAITVRHLADRGFSGDDYRYWLLTSHYRSPANFTWEALKGSKQALFRIKRHMYEDYKQKPSTPDKDYLEKFDQRLADDLDTPGAIAIMWDMIKDKKLADTTKAGTLLSMDEILDIGLSDKRAEGARALGVVAKDDIPDEVRDLIDAREVARIGREWPEADALRDRITQKGYTVEDSEHGPRVTKI
jgi:cysteinyl-tRNA synthetase